jgi:acyl-CoA synthetase (AMP-forming)/AMP-acid ligase II
LFADVDFTALRFAVLSGSTVPATLSAAFEDLLPNGRVVQAWGIELQFGACSRPSDPRRVRFETIGRATPGTELRVTDSEDRVLPCGEVGELHVRGCSLFSGYVRNPEASRAAFTADGWLRTGDLASMDEKGNVLLRGRTKDLINRGGVKFNPIDMEIAIAGHPAVAQVAIVFRGVEKRRIAELRGTEGIPARAQVRQIHLAGTTGDRFRYAGDADPEGHEGGTGQSIS